MTAHGWIRMTCVLIGVMALPAVSLAQSSIAGLVTDSSGGILPGVTVEVSSPALIEKTRTATTDAQGRYDIVNLRPGMYAVVFTLTGFSTFRRDGIEVQANVNVPINARAQSRGGGGNRHGVGTVPDGGCESGGPK